MQLLILGPGRLGSAIAGEAVRAGWPPPLVRGRPPGGIHDPADLPPADVVVDASRGEAVAGNVDAALAAGARSFILAATGWDDDVARVSSSLLSAGAAAVLAPNLSIGAALFLRLAEAAAGWYARADGFEPFVFERHRRGKADRPSGTARQLASRVVTADPRWSGPIPTGPGRADRPALEVTSVRAGSSPGVHVVGFDAPGETVELHLTARDRSAYAAGALAAARWLGRERREPGVHPFDRVVDDLLAPVGPVAPGAVPVAV